ncbi:MAG: sulfotransferase [Candidatus Falkowbacteria bacterium]|nr:sulfotransferase [Candidatus Falkowbacteria bacterium]
MKNIYLGTYPRSGSTLLGMMLGAHSQICHIGESSYWARVKPEETRCCCGTIGCETLLHIKAEILKSSNPLAPLHVYYACIMLDVQEKVLGATGELRDVTFDKLGFKNINEALDACLGALDLVATVARQITRKKIIVENLKYPQIAEALLKKYANWWSVVIVRDPRGVALSTKKEGEKRGSPNPIKDQIFDLLTLAKRINVLIQKPKTIFVRYEDLCHEPSQVLEKICDFIGIPFETKMLQFKQHKGHLLMGNQMMHDNNEIIREDLRWHTELSEEEKSFFLQVNFVEAYQQLGYSLN